MPEEAKKAGYFSTIKYSIQRFTIPVLFLLFLFFDRTVPFSSNFPRPGGPAGRMALVFQKKI
jgi:hypothetical protein